MKIEEIAIKRGYIVTEDGKLINPSGKEIGLMINSSGYRTSGIRFCGKKVHLLVHRLQAYQKYGCKMYYDKIMVRHYNGVKLDNSWSNILIGNNQQNQLDIPKQERIKRCFNSTLKTKKYNNLEVKNYHDKSKSYKKTMEHFSISSKGTLSYILNSN